MARQQTNKIIREEKKIAKGRGGTIHQGHFSFIVSFLLSSRVFLFVLFISPFGRFGVWCVVQRGGIGDGGAFRGDDLLLCARPCLCNYIPQIPTEARGWAIIGSTMRVIFHYSFILMVIMSESAHGRGIRLVLSCHRCWLCGRTRTALMLLLFLRGSFLSTNLFLFIYLFGFFFLPGTQVFSCTLKPALLWLLVADQR